MNDKINIYINSKNRDESESASEFNVVIPQGILRLQQDEYFTLNVNAFSCFNSWYNCITGFNSRFDLVYYKSDGTLKEVLEYNIIDGNPSVLNIKSWLNVILVNQVVVNYDGIKNKLTYKRIKPVTDDYHKLYIRVLNAEDFLGFYRYQRNKLFELPFNELIYSPNVINVNGDECILIELSGDIAIDNTCSVDNFGDNLFQPSKIIFTKAIDAPSGSLLSYNNEDGGDSFQYRVANTESISHFTLRVYNQDKELIPNFADFLLNLQFVKHKHEDDTKTILKKLLEYVRDIFMLISNQIFPSN